MTASRDQSPPHKLGLRTALRTSTGYCLVQEVSTSKNKAEKSEKCLFKMTLEPSSSDHRDSCITPQAVSPGIGIVPSTLSTKYTYKKYIL